MRLLFPLFPALLLAAGCRTQVAPYQKPDPVVVYVGEKSCNVYDFPSATEVPEGAKNLGWVTVKRKETDEETFLLLRQKVCELGGDALSQMAWVHDEGDYEPSLLRGNAWVLP